MDHFLLAQDDALAEKLLPTHEDAHNILSVEDFHKKNNTKKQLKLTETDFINRSLLTAAQCADLDYYLQAWWSLQKREKPPVPSYVKGNSVLNGEMRYQIIEWICDSACDLNLQRQTFHLSVNYLDGFLQRKDITIDELQFLGAACLYLATKFEENSQSFEKQNPQNFVLFALGDNEDDEELLEDAVCKLSRYESLILEVLDFDIKTPTAHEWLMLYFQNAAIIDPKTFAETPDPKTKKRILQRIFDQKIFYSANRQLDTAIASAHSLGYSNSLLAAAVFYSHAHDRFHSSECEKFTLCCTGYEIKNDDPILSIVNNLEQKDRQESCLEPEDDPIESVEKQTNPANMNLRCEDEEDEDEYEYDQIASLKPNLLEVDDDNDDDDDDMEDHTSEDAQHGYLNSSKAAAVWDGVADGEE